MKAVIFLAVLLVSANCWGFGSIAHAFHNVGHAITHEAKNVGHAVTHEAQNVGHAVTNEGKNVGDQIKNGAQQFGNDVKNEADNIDAKLKQVGQNFEKLASEGAHIATSVANRVRDAAEDVAAEAERIYKDLRVPLECAEAILENIQIFYRFYEIYNDPSKIVLEWNPMADELYDVCVTCSGGDSSKFAWIKEIELQGGDMDVAMCIADIVDLSISGVEMINVEDDIDPEVILDFINSLIDMTQDCPSAIAYLKKTL
jgi:hypothetical protein